MKKCNNKNIKSILKYVCIIIISVLLYMNNTLYGTNYYVRTNGNNGDPGTNWTTAWETIGYAASNVGAGNVVTVSNGVYNEQVDMQNNGTAGNYIIFKATNQGKAVVDASGKDYGFYLNGKSYIRIEGFVIKNATSRGIEIEGAETNNCVYIVKNIIYSNSGGVTIYAGNNFIFSNQIYKNGSDGIGISSGSNNIIMSNQIYNHTSSGIWLNQGSSSNIIKKNVIYSNMFAGVNINSNTSIHNQVHYNEIYCCDNGIYIGSFSKSNYISHNNIFSNPTNGISIYKGNHNSIFSNNIYGHNQNTGIRIQHGTNTKIYRNAIYNNEQNGILLLWDSSDTEIINNTIFGSISSNGVLWIGNSSGVMYNNIILSNGNGAGDYGIAGLSSGSVYVAYNDIHGNTGGHTNGTLIWGSGNITNNPMIDTTSSFEITSASSPCVDSGTNIQGITDGHHGDAPDMGWKEFPIGAGYTSLVVYPDKEAGRYIGDLDLKLTAYKDSTKQEIDATALIDVTILRNNTSYQSHAEYGNIDLNLPAGAKYILKFYATDTMNNTSEIKEAEYIVLKENPEEIAVYPTIVNPNEREKVTFIYKERKSNVDIKICTLRGNVVRTIKGVDFSKGFYEYSTQNLRSLPASQYILKIENKKVLFILIK